MRDQQVSSFQTFYTSNQGSGGLGQPIRKDGNTKYIYIRVKNRGKALARNVQVTVYWSRISTLPILAQWVGNSIETVTIPTIPGGMMQVVEIPWANSAIPQPEIYSFVGIIGTTKDTAPNPLVINNWAGYRSFVRDNNNVARCNFRVDP